MKSDELSAVAAAVAALGEPGEEVLVAGHAAVWADVPARELTSAQKAGNAAGVIAGVALGVFTGFAVLARREAGRPATTRAVIVVTNTRLLLFDVRGMVRTLPDRLIASCGHAALRDLRVNPAFSTGRLTIRGLNHDLVLNFIPAKQGPPVLRQIEAVVAANLEAERVAAARAGSPQAAAQHEAVQAHVVAGDQALAARDLSMARERYEQAVRVASEGLRADPENQRLPLALSVASSRLGDIHVELGDGAAAAPHYRRSVEAGAEAVRVDPDHARAASDFSILALKLADLLVADGDLARARTYYRLCLDMRQHVSDIRPDDPVPLRAVAEAHLRLGDLAAREGDAAGARAQYGQARDVFLQLVEAHPANHDFHREHYLALMRIGAYEFAGEADAAGRATALRTMREALQLAERLRERDPGNADVRADIAALRANVSKLGG